MPVIRHKRPSQKHVHVYRPDGTRYAEGRDAHVANAISKARTAFLDEFGYEPHQSHTFIEVMGVTADWVAVVFEIKD